MERIIHFGLEDVFSLSLGKPTFDTIFVHPGKGKGNRETGTPTSFEEKVQELDAQIAAGKMEERDWKCRYGGYQYTEESKFLFALRLRIGPTSWSEWREDYKRSEEDAAALQKRGEQEHNDRGFYLSNGLGATVLTLTREKEVVVGVRKSDSYDGAIHGAAGWMKFNKDISKVHPVNDAYRELREELAIKQDQVSSLRLVGLVAYPKTLEADFVFVAKTDKEREYFTSGAWKEAVDAKEHRELVVLANPQQIGSLLQEGKAPGQEKKYEVLASTAYGLEVLAQQWDKLR